MVRRYLAPFPHRQASVTLPVTPPAGPAEEEANDDGENCSGLMSTVTSLVPFGSFPESGSSCHPSAVRTPDLAGAPDPAGTPGTAGTPDPAVGPASTPGRIRFESLPSRTGAADSVPAARLHWWPALAHGVPSRPCATVKCPTGG